MKTRVNVRSLSGVFTLTVALLVVLSLFGWTARQASAETTGSIAGVINDGNGDPYLGIPVQVRVVLRSDGSEVSLTHTNPLDGSYLFTNLPLDQELVVVADVDGYETTFYQTAGDMSWAEIKVLSLDVPNLEAVNIQLTNERTSIEHLTFNTRPGRLLSNVTIRQAIAYGTDRQAILDGAFEPNGLTGEIVHVDMYPYNWFSAAPDDPLLKTYAFNPTQANSLLEGAGWIDTDEDGVREKDGQELALVFATSTAPARIASADIFTTQMAAIGIRITVNTYPGYDFFSDDPALSVLVAGNFDIAEFLWEYRKGEYLPRRYHHTTEENSGENYGGYVNLELDGYYNDARAAKWVGDRPSFLNNALAWQYLFSEDLPVLPMFTRIPMAVGNGVIQGVIHEVHGSPLTGISVSVRVLLIHTGTEIASTYTDPADGSYLFTNLPLDQELAVVANDQNSDTSGYTTVFYDNDGALEWATPIVLTIENPDRTGMDMYLVKTVTGEQLTFNTRADHLFEDVRLRQAVAYGIDRQIILDQAFILNGFFGEVINTYLHPDSWYLALPEDPLLTVYSYNPSMARSILDDAGWATINAEGFREKDGQELVIDFTTTNVVMRAHSAELIKNQLAEIGIRVNVILYPPEILFSDDPSVSPLISGDFDIAEFAWMLYDEDFLTPLFSTGFEKNYGGYSNLLLDEYHDAANEAASIGDESGFLTYAMAWQYLFTEDLPVLPMFTRIPVGVIDGVIQGSDGNPLIGISVPVRVLLKTDGAEIASTYTDPADGTYRFTNLPLNQELVVVASDEVPDIDGFSARYFNNAASLELAEGIWLGSFNPAFRGAAITLNHTIEAVIGVDGGTIITEDEKITFSIPTGAISEPLLFSITDGGSGYEVVSEGNPLLVVDSYTIQPSGTEFDLPATLTFQWDDADNDGIVDGTSLQEVDLVLLKDGSAISIPCGENPACNLVSNSLTVTISSLSLFELAIPVNRPPVLQAVSAPLDPYPVNTTVEATATFLDADINDTHTAAWDWGDGQTSAGMVNEISQEVSGSHAYTSAGVYTVKLTLTDAAGAMSELTYRYLVIYDSSAGFVTGGGWFDSPAGAYTPEPSMTGKATFGFVSKYQKGTSIPTGETEFQFKAAGLTFSSTSYDWLVIAGARAQYKGTGTIDGAGTYRFMLTAIDGQIIGGGGVDKFRIKIWDPVTDEVIYDNQFGVDEDALPSTVLGGGAIVIHK